MGEPEAGVPLSRAIANHQHSAGCEMRGETIEQPHLVVRPEIMKQVEEDQVAARAERLAGILFDEIEILIVTIRRTTGPCDLALVAVERGDRSREISLP